MFICKSFFGHDPNDTKWRAWVMGKCCFPWNVTLLDVGKKIEQVTSHPENSNPDRIKEIAFCLQVGNLKCGVNFC